MTVSTRRPPTQARNLQTRLAHAEATRRDAHTAWHNNCCQKLGLPQTATDDQINAEFARRIAESIHHYERQHGILPVLPPATPGDDLASLDDMTFFARGKAMLIQDGYLPQDIPGDTP